MHAHLSLRVVHFSPLLASFQYYHYFCSYAFFFFISASSAQGPGDLPQSVMAQTILSTVAPVFICLLVMFHLGLSFMVWLYLLVPICWLKKRMSNKLRQFSFRGYRHFTYGCMKQGNASVANCDLSVIELKTLHERMWKRNTQQNSYIGFHL